MKELFICNNWEMPIDKGEFGEQLKIHIN
jgi:hypothetical protein